MLEELQSCNHQEVDYDYGRHRRSCSHIVLAFLHFTSMSCVLGLVLANIGNIFQYMKLLAIEVRSFVEQYHFSLH